MRIRKAQPSNFTTVQNSIINSDKISFKAKGIYLYLFSKPDDWSFSVERIARANKDGREAVNSGIKELEKVGLIERIKTVVRDLKTGHIKNETEYIIYDYIQTTGFPESGEAGEYIRKSITKKDIKNTKKNNLLGINDGNRVSLSYHDVKKNNDNFKNQ